MHDCNRVESRVGRKQSNWTQDIRHWGTICIECNRPKSDRCQNPFRHQTSPRLDPKRGPNPSIFISILIFESFTPLFFTQHEAYRIKFNISLPVMAHKKLFECLSFFSVLIWRAQQPNQRAEKPWRNWRWQVANKYSGQENERERACFPVYVNVVCVMSRWMFLREQETNWAILSVKNL
jgi:hypothetical protein